eukprot:c24986_g1_i1 orf=457-1539(-)
MASQAGVPAVAELPQWQGIAHHRHAFNQGAIFKAPGQGRAGWQTLAFKAITAVNGKENFPISEQGRRTGTSTDATPFSSKETKLSRQSNGSNELDDEMAQSAYKHKGNKGEDPYRILEETGRKVYLDELDVLTLLDPPSFLIPTDANTYNQAAYLWKKIGDIPEERRHNLLSLLTPKQVANMWDIAGQMYGHPNPPLLEPANVLLGTQSELFMKPVTWTGKAFNVSWPLTWFSTFQKVFFLATDGSVYGRVITGGWLLKSMTKWLLPLYFEVRETRKVVATEEPCNIALEYGDGQLHLQEVPQNFPKPARHPWPFSDASFDYLRPAGPGVLVGQWWIEGIDLEQMPEKRLDFVLIKDYGS